MTLKKFLIGASSVLAFATPAFAQEHEYLSQRTRQVVAKGEQAIVDLADAIRTTLPAADRPGAASRG